MSESGRPNWFRAVYRSAVLVFFMGVAAVDGAMRGYKTTRERAAWMQRWAKRGLRLLHVTVDASGLQPCDAMVSNHLTYLDVMVIGSLQPCVFVCKSEVKGWPVVGGLVVKTGAIFLDRSSPRAAIQAARDMRKAMDEGVCIVFFPEGTTSDATGVLPFHAALFQAVAKTQLKLVAAHLAYSVDGAGEELMRERVYFWGDMEFGPHMFGLCGLPGVHATVKFAAPIECEADRGELAERAHAEIVAMHGAA